MTTIVTPADQILSESIISEENFDDSNRLLFRISLIGMIYKEFTLKDKSIMNHKEYESFLNEIKKVKYWGIDLYDTNYSWLSQIFIYLPIICLPIIAILVIWFFYKLAHWIIIGIYILYLIYLLLWQWITSRLRQQKISLRYSDLISILERWNQQILKNRGCLLNLARDGLYIELILIKTNDVTIEENDMEITSDTALETGRSEQSKLKTDIAEVKNGTTSRNISQFKEKKKALPGQSIQYHSSEMVVNNDMDIGKGPDDEPSHTEIWNYQEGSDVESNLEIEANKSNSEIESKRKSNQNGNLQEKINDSDNEKEADNEFKVPIVPYVYRKKSMNCANKNRESLISVNKRKESLINREGSQENKKSIQSTGINRDSLMSTAFADEINK